jgi:hypothetical protein
MSNNKQIEKPLELPHQETIVGINTIQTKPFDNQKTMSNNKQTTDMTWDEYGNPKPSINGGDNMNNNPGNLNMTVLRNHITMYLNDIESYGTRKELADATDVLFDFVKYINALDGEQAMIDYNAMEEEWEMDNYNEMQ